MATDLGKAYVQIVPSARGISQSIRNELSPGAEQAGRNIGSNLVGTIKKAVIAAGVGKIIGDSILEGGALEQSIGGAKKLYGDAFSDVMKNAQEAYKTAGVSANQYLEGVNSFAASLMQSTGGNAQEAAKISDMAYRDMSDNANTYGKSMEEIENAYKGFARGQYMMLDNLSLGYDGTKQEMERLLVDAEKLTGVKYDINNLSDVYNAIHAIQGELKITGTSAKEAETTIQGSFHAMKAAFDNSLGAIALGESITPALQGLAETVSTFLFGNLLPMVITVLQSLPEAIATFFTTAAPLFFSMGGELLSNIASGITEGIPLFLDGLIVISGALVQWVQTQLPVLIDSGVNWISSLAQGMMSNLPSVIQTIGEILLNVLTAIADAFPNVLEGGFELIQNLATGIFDNLPAVSEAIGDVLAKIIELIVEKAPDILSKGIELMGSLAEGILENLPTVASAILTILRKVISKIIEHFPEIVQKGIELIGKLAAGIIRAVGKATEAAGKIGREILKTIKGFLGDMVSVGFDLLSGLATGIGNAVGGVVSAAIDAAGRVVGAVKGFFGIQSPSKVFSEIGMYLDRGLAEGIEDNINPISKAMDAVESEIMRDMSSSLDYGLKSECTADNLSDCVFEDEEKQGRPLIVKLILGGNEYKAFVEDITNEQEKVVDLHLSYEGGV